MLGKKEKTGFESPNRLNTFVEGTRIIGSVNSESNIRIDGDIEGDVFSAGKVVVGENGTVKGNLNCNEAEVLGKLEGDLRVDQLLVLREKSLIHGNIRTNRILVEEGAQFFGNCEVGGKVPEKKKQKPTVVVNDNPEDLVY